jgi:curved DNA-binding protein CbpA
VSTDPFAALGLPARNDLTNEQVRAAWREIAAATHPDRPDGGDIARYTAAASAYAQLRTQWGRSEAYADQVETAAGYGYDGYGYGSDGAGTAPLPAVGGDGDEMPPRPGAALARLARAGWLLPARVARGRPLRLALRGIAAAVMSAVVLRLVGGQPAGPAVVTGILTWFVLTGRGDLAPPPGR